ncbi:hypothetical protein RB653_002678 [Dictyostelium firmibasis]|uniref:Transmembrane protein n=1 Tax=Dictyostelium firmibasis TaxID=79012 RepID=A0AAN7YSY5_9MYCE
MKLLLALILVIVNCCFINANKLFINFQGSYSSNTCEGSGAGIGFALTVGQCMPMEGVLSYVINDLPQTTNWLATLGSDGNSFTLKEYQSDDQFCKQAPISTLQFDQFDTCVQQPAFLNVNNSLLADTLVYSKLSLSQNSPSYGPDSIIFGQYNTNSNVCTYNNQQFGVSYTSGTVLYDVNGVTIHVSCNQADQSMMFKCKDGKCGENFIDTYCQMSGDVQIY